MFSKNEKTKKINKYNIKLFLDDNKIEQEDIKMHFLGLFHFWSENTSSKKIEEFENYIYHIGRIFSDIFSDIVYIGPLRQKPEASYPDSGSQIIIGKNGEYATQILGKESKNNCPCPIFNGSQYEIKDIPLIDAVNHWLCKEFKMAKAITATRTTTISQILYVLEVINENDIVAPITHVGFGISQVLPIVVAGLRMNEGEILILEQPEIHLHPKIQSLLFDFLYGLTRKGVKIIVETHSDHFINRMRLRVAEDLTNTMAEKMNLTFIEPNRPEGEFHQLELDEYGTVDYWPKDFFDQYGQDTRAIVKAQGVKERAKRNLPKP